MAGIYIHIPFCNQACHYCNFHFSTTFESYREEMIEVLCKELELKKSIFSGVNIQTIYFGGGTPSLLTEKEFDQIFFAINTNYETGLVEEITIEANPEDVNEGKLSHWKSKGVTRVSLGVQSFFKDDLEQMNRVHSSSQAEEAIQLIKEAEFESYSIDFMFALPLLTDEQLHKNLDKALELKVPHISCYNLTIEEQTALVQLIKKGKIEDLSEEKSIKQFELIMDKLGSNRYLQYEISNYALEGHKSKHNSAYWEQKAYIGIGPSAHSLYDSMRTHNVSNNKAYINEVNNEGEYYEIEEMSEQDFFNEFIMTRLRTSKGLDVRDLEILFPQYVSDFKDKTSDFLRGGQLAFFGDEYRLTKQGKLMADYIASEFFIVE